MTPKEVAAVLQVPERSLTYWRSIGEGPVYVRIGKHVRYEPGEVRAYVAGPPAHYNRHRRLHADLAGYLERDAA